MTAYRPAIIVSGANGQLAKEIKFLSKQNKTHLFKFLNKEELDITSKKSLSECFKKYKPDFFINCAAYTAVDNAEKEAKKAFKTNTKGAAKVAKICSKYDCTLIHISSDYVYDNGLQRPLLETDPCKPKGVYAKSKYEGELKILQDCPNSIIIRSSWIYSPHGSNFVKTMLRLLEEREELLIVNDQIGNPTFARDLAEIIINNVIARLSTSSDKSLYGIYNYSNEGAVSWFDFAKEIQKISGLECEIKGISTEDYNAPAKRPLYSVLNKTKIMKSFAIADIPNWKDSLVICISELNN